MEEQDFFVGIYEPLDVRRNLLESSREVIKSLQGYERIEKIRDKKAALRKKMQSIMKELGFLLVKMRERLPKSYLRKEEPTKIIEDVKIVMDQPQLEELSLDLKSLEEQLRAIETQLSKLI